MSDLFAELMEEGRKQKQAVNQTKAPPKIMRNFTQDTTHSRELSREQSRGNVSKVLLEETSDLPTRDEIQEFSFRLRDTLRVKVQAEVPHEWQAELEEMAVRLRVGKLELYRFIFGEFLGKVKRKKFK